METARANFPITDEAEIQAFLYSHQPGKEAPPRPGEYLGYQLVREYLLSHLDGTDSLFKKPASELLKRIANIE